MEWAVEEGYQYELWTDQDKTLALYYGAISSESATYCDRITVVLDPEGALFLEYLDSVSTGTHPGQVLEDLTKLIGE